MLTLALLALASNTGNDDWPTWRGPQGSGVAAGNPPIEFGEDHNLRWKTPIPGKGLSVPVVWKDRVYLTTAVGTGEKREMKEDDGTVRTIEAQDFVVLALERATGEVVWQKKVASQMPHQGTHEDGSFASPSPLFDGETLYASFGSFGVYALSPDGELRWQQDLGDLTIQGGFGEGSTPVLVGEVLVLNWDHEGDSFLIGLDRRTGKERWRTPRPSGTNWSSPVVAHTGGKDVVVVAGPITIGYDPAGGKELWRNEGTGGSIASPITQDELVVWCANTRGGGQVCALVAGPEPLEAPEPLLWSAQVRAPGIASPVAYEGKIYLLRDDNGMLSVLDAASGKIEYGPERLDAVQGAYASLVVAANHLYVTGREGTIEVVALAPEILTVAVNQLDDRFDASPAVAGDELFLRGHASLYCFAE